MFDLDSFKKENSDDVTDNGLPVWVDQSKPKIVALAKAVHNEFKAKHRAIKDSPDKISIKDRQIQNAAVCKVAGVVRSYLRADRKDTELIIKYIDNKNKELNELWLNEKSKLNKSGRKLLKADLDSQNRKLKKQLKETQIKNDSELFRLWIDSNLLDVNKKLVAKIRDIEAQNEALTNDNAQLKDELRKLKLKLV